MTDYNEFPPIKCFMRVLKNCPKSALIYAQLWKTKGDHPTLRIDKRDIRKEYFISPTIFRNLLIPLTDLYLVTFYEIAGNFQIWVNGSQQND